MPRPVTQDDIRLREELVALLEERPYSTSQLATILRKPNGAIYAVLEQLRRQGQTMRFPHPDRRWALAGTDVATAPPPLPDPKPGTSSHGTMLANPKGGRPKTAPPAGEGAWWTKHASPGASRDAFERDLAEQHRKRLLKASIPGRQPG